jgi:4-hydroxy-L-threonine phosphate dehydrogenase PdxA
VIAVLLATELRDNTAPQELADAVLSVCDIAPHLDLAAVAQALTQRGQSTTVRKLAFALRTMQSLRSEP